MADGRSCFDETSARQLAAAETRDPVFAEKAQIAPDEIQRLCELVERAAQMLEAKSDRAARVEWAAALRVEVRRG